MSINYTANVNTTNAESKLNTLQEKMTRVDKALVATIRRTTQIGLSLFQAFGGAIDQSYALGIEAALLSIELYSSIAVAGGLTGVGAFHAVALGASIASILATIVLLENGRAEAAGQMQHLTNIGRSLSYS